jgi:predicted transcriptional regulator
MSYTPGMKTAISVPDAVYERAERLARRLNKSRSQLYSEALAEYLARHHPDAITKAYDEVCKEIDSGQDDFGREAARRTFERINW